MAGVNTFLSIATDIWNDVLELNSGLSKYRVDTSPQDLEQDLLSQYEQSLRKQKVKRKEEAKQKKVLILAGLAAVSFFALKG